ncbi:MAG TPA: 1-(5-phosphoribosyl)-5-[(5-phosphoribosylamino)methylideneamino]imidazole-4-carboxamide isomerase [Candidatus Omnitrophota bacterium]|nr:1-(5-phosphoribosyl)-5-[(5-phosphoribosylamino)methylideneamino]imidazole-4-carboxamide isomerase [Candidatus Omnitrophota bacterium]
MKILPAIDIIDGKTVRLERGKYNKKLSYDISPVDAAREWESMGADMLHVIDLDGAKEGKPVNLSVIKEIAHSVSIPIEVGGGYRKESDIKKALNMGIARVIVGSKALEEPEFGRSVIENFKDRVIISVDADRYELRVRGWKKGIAADIFDVFARLRSYGAKRIIYTDISKDGTLSGPDKKLLKDILDRSKLKMIYAGGIKSVAHVKELKKLEKHGLSGAIIGRALYDGTIDLAEAIDVS